MRRFTWMICALILVGSAAAQSGPPALCKPCLFYGGDTDQNDIDQEAFSNELTLSSEANTYPAITIPKGHAALIEGILFQVMLLTPPDPKGATWDIRVKVDQGGGGTSIASGEGRVVMQPTGRFYHQYSEYTTVIKVNPPVQITGGNDFHGTKYWFNLTPVCENNKNPACETNPFFVSNSPHETNSFRAGLQQVGQAVIDGMGFNWESVCTAYSLNGNQCAWLSFGLMGKVVQ